MRGDDRQQPDLFLYGTLEHRIPDNHPLRRVRAMTDAALRQTRHRGRERVAWMFTFAAAAYNMVRIRNLMEASA